MSLTAIILSGGKSSRMGSEKGLVSWQGKGLVKHSLALAANFTNDCMIIANDPLYEIYGPPVFPDLVEEKGPLGGMYTGLSHSKTELNLVLSCDAPLIPVELISFLLKKAKPEFDVVCPRHQGKLQPLCALYKKRILPEIKNAIENNQLALHKLLSNLNTQVIEINDELDFYFPEIFFNVNSPDDLRKLDEIKRHGS